VSLDNPRPNNHFGLFLFVLLVAILACLAEQPRRSDAIAIMSATISCKAKLAANQAGARALMRELEARDPIMKQMKLFVCCEADDCSDRTAWFPIWAGESQTAEDLDCQGRAIEVAEVF
jgi:hypothetical protein